MKQIKSRAISLLLALLILVTVCPTVLAESSTGERYGMIVNCTYSINVRAGAGSTTEKIGTALKGNVYRVLGVEGNWTKISFTNNKAGYVFSQYIQEVSAPTGPVETPAGAGEKLRIVNCSYGVNVRAKATSSSDKVGTAQAGKEYVLLSTVVNGTSTWYQVQYTEEKTGFVFGSYGKVISAPDAGMVTIQCKEYVTIRSEASSASAKVGTATNGETFRYLGKSGNWIKIQYSAKKTGYVYGAYAKLQVPEEGQEIKETGYIVVTGGTVYVRNGAGTSNGVLGVAKINEVYEVMAKAEGWYKIRFHGNTGYISAKYADKVISSKKMAEIVNCKTSVNVRDGVGTDSTVIGAASLGKTYPYLKSSGNYIMVSYSGKVGYIHKSYVKVA